VANGQQVVDHLEALVAGGVVDGGDVRDLGEFGGGVVLEEGEDGDDAGRRDVDGEFVFPNGEPVVVSTLISGVWWLGKERNALLDVFGKARQKVLAVLVEGLRLVLGLVCRVVRLRLHLRLAVAGSYRLDRRLAHVIGPVALSAHASGSGARSCRPWGGCRACRRWTGRSPLVVPLSSQRSVAPRSHMRPPSPPELPGPASGSPSVGRPCCRLNGAWARCEWQWRHPVKLSCAEVMCSGSWGGPQT
jgi:hypothetical protein